MKMLKKNLKKKKKKKLFGKQCLNIYLIIDNLFTFFCEPNDHIISQTCVITFTQIIIICTLLLFVLMGKKKKKKKRAA
jgi:hypothetical protein